ncbi:MAG: sensor histidine kinase [Fibrobacterota bacterium]
MSSKNIFRQIYSRISGIHPELHIYLFIALIILGVIWYAGYTSFMIERLTRYSKASTQAHAELVSDVLFSEMNTYRKHNVIDDIVEDFDMPIIFTDEDGEPQIWWNIYREGFFDRREISYEDVSPGTMDYLRQKAKEFGEVYTPKLVYEGSSKTRMGWLYYTDSNFLQGVALLPFFEVFFVIILIFAIYMVLKSILFAERSNLWIGLAKETAHQMGTPITSLVGWVDYLKMESQNRQEGDLFGLDGLDDFDSGGFPGTVQTIARDMEKDITRLRKVANRFEMIGSRPVLREGNLENLLQEHKSYFEKRLPVIGRSISFTLEFRTDLPPVRFNQDLLGWVFENLFKNSLDAMDKPEGEIRIEAEHVSVDHKIVIHHRDNGKGVPRDKRNSVFNPGFTTKRRGWGLGLALARRIVSTYHGGKIYISDSRAGEGTEFRIELPVHTAPKEKRPK